MTTIKGEEMQAWCHPPVQPQLTFQRGAAAAFRQSIQHWPRAVHARASNPMKLQLQGLTLTEYGVYASQTGAQNHATECLVL